MPVTPVSLIPAAVREELNRRLHDGQPDSELLAWLNGLPETRQIASPGAGNVEFTPDTLARWRRGPYRKWLDAREKHHARLDRIQELCAVGLKLAEASGGNLSEGAASVLGGAILEVLERIDALTKCGPGQTARPATIAAAAAALASLSASVARLRRGDHDRTVARQNDRRLEQKDKEMALAQAAFEQKLKEYQDTMEARKREWDDALPGAERGGISLETLEKIEAAAKLL